MPHRDREYLVTTRTGDIFGIVRIVRSADGHLSFQWSPGDGSPNTIVSIPETMRASQFLDAWIALTPEKGLQLTG
jgi:hypothetical protein